MVVEHAPVMLALPVPQAIARARADADPERRHAIYRELSRTLARETVVHPLYYEKHYRFAHPRVSGLKLCLGRPVVAYEELRLD